MRQVMHRAMHRVVHGAMHCLVHGARCTCTMHMHDAHARCTVHDGTGRAPPRLAGDRKPSMAQKMAMQAIASSCIPVPRLATRHMGKEGGRKTSACTSFQPLSSWVGVKVSVGARERRLPGGLQPPSWGGWRAATVCVQAATAPF